MISIAIKHHRVY